METRKNLCAMLPVALHTRVRQEQEKAGMTLGEYVEAMITEYYDWKDGKIMTGEMRTMVRALCPRPNQAPLSATFPFRRKLQSCWNRNMQSTRKIPTCFLPR